jgi:hypothetical protein
MIWDLLRATDQGAMTGVDGATIDGQLSLFDDVTAASARTGLLASARGVGFLPEFTDLAAAVSLPLTAAAGAYVIYDSFFGTHHRYYKLELDPLGPSGYSTVAGLPTGWGLDFAGWQYEPMINGGSGGVLMGSYPPLFVLTQSYHYHSIGDYHTCGGFFGFASGGWVDCTGGAETNELVPDYGNANCGSAHWLDCLRFDSLGVSGTDISAATAVGTAMYINVTDVVDAADPTLGAFTFAETDLNSTGFCGFYGSNPFDTSKQYDCLIAALPVSAVYTALQGPLVSNPGGAVVTAPVPSGVDWTSNVPDLAELAGGATSIEADPCLRLFVDHYLAGAAWPLPDCTGDAPNTIPLPQPPDPNQTCDDYVSMLATIGYIGDASCVTLPETSADPRVGPGGPVKITWPVPGGGIRVLSPWSWPDPIPQIQPEQTLTIYQNPDDTPPIDTGTGGDGGGGGTDTSCAPVSVPSLDLTPLENVDFGNKFPFGVVAWMKNGIAGWDTGLSDAPTLTLPMFYDNFGSTDPVNTTIDLSRFDPFMITFRALLVLEATIGAIWAYGSAALGWGRGGEQLTFPGM